MLILLAIGFLAGVVTAVSPCVLPVLPILLAGGASGRKPLRIVAGLVASFTVFTLFAAWLLDQLGLPEDFLRNVGDRPALRVAATLLVPRRGLLIERPLARLLALPAGGRRRRLLPRRDARARLRAVRGPGARHDHGRRGQQLGRPARDPADARLRRSAPPCRCSLIAAAARGLRPPAPSTPRRCGSSRASLIAAVAIALVFHLDDTTSRRSPRATRRSCRSKLEEQLDRQARAREGARRRAGARGRASKTPKGEPARLRRRTAAPRRRRVDQHEAADARLAARQGRARRLLDVLVHQLPAHAAAPEGLVRDVPRQRARDHRRAHARVRVRARDVERRRLPSSGSASSTRSMQDNDYKTWDNYANQYWPAEYLIDKQGHVRHTHFGEGEYPQTESLIRRLLGDNGAHAQAARRRDADRPADARELPRVRAPRELRRHATGAERRPRLSLPPSTIPRTRSRTTGSWRVGAEQIVAGKDARLRLRFQAQERLHRPRRPRHGPRAVDGKPTGTIHVGRTTALHGPSVEDVRDGAAGAALHARRPGVLVHVRVAGLRLAGDVVVAFVVLALAQEARELGGDRVARTADPPRRPARRPGARDPATYADVSSSVATASLTCCAYASAASSSSAVSTSAPSRSPEPVDERLRRPRRRSQRDVVRDGRPEARRLEAGARAGVVQHADHPGRPFVARCLEAELVDQVGIGRARR